jgi:transcriptional coactivator HFI1/ADA1
MQIDPAALSRTDPASGPVSANKAVAPTTNPTQKSTKPLISVPRLDLEPIYTELKGAIGDNWAEYKQSTALFLLGMQAMQPPGRVMDQNLDSMIVMGALPF